MWNQLPLAKLISQPEDLITFHIILVLFLSEQVLTASCSVTLLDFAGPQAKIQDLEKLIEKLSEKLNCLSLTSDKNETGSQPTLTFNVFVSLPKIHGLHVCLTSSFMEPKQEGLKGYTQHTQQR